MLDSGSEINVIREGYISDENLIDTSKKILITGICTNPILSLGTVNKVILGRTFEFVVVPNNFHIPFAGILGSELFLDSKTKINFRDKTFTIGNKLINFFQNDKPYSEIMDKAMLNMSIENSLKCLPFIEIINAPLCKRGYFMIDSGSEANLIKLNLIPDQCKFDTTQQVVLRGIGEEITKSLGAIRLKIHDVFSLFYVVPNNFPIPGQGIIGSLYLTQAKALIDYENKCLRVGNFSSPIKFKSLKEVNQSFDNNVPSSNASLKSINSMNVNLDTTLDEIDDDLNNYVKETANNLKEINDFYTTNKIEILENEENFLDFTELSTKQIFRIAYQETFAELDTSIKTDEEIDDSYNLFNNLENEIELPVSRIFEIEIDNDLIIDKLRLNHLNNDEIKHVQNLIIKHKNRFLLEGQHLGAASTVMHRIITTDDIPVNAKQYKFPISLKDEVNRQVEELLEAGIIKPSISPYNAPLWMVPKKLDSSGIQKWRLVSDFRLLNEKTITDAYPLPDITQIIDQVGGHKYYTVLDLASGFHQILMDPRDSHKTAFSTPYGHYEYVRMTFGLKNAPPTFQRYIDETFKGLQGKILFSFIDDIVIFADTLEEHNEKLELVMERLKQANLQLNINKCEFLKSHVCYLGHILSKDGISPDPKKIEAVKCFPQLSTVKNVRQFLGLAGYYRRFIKHFANLSKPLTKLLEKDVEFHWDEKTEKAFTALKEALCNPPILQYPDFSKTFIITTDASGYAVGGVLSQGEIGKDLPIGYTSRLLRGSELNYEVYEKEALAMIHCSKIFRSYIYNKKIKFITDHKPLVWFKTADCNTRVQKWRFKLSEFDYEVLYKPGKLNANADALSRNPVCNVITRRQAKLINENENLIEKINNEHNQININPIPLSKNPDTVNEIDNNKNKEKSINKINNNKNKEKSLTEPIKKRVSKRIIDKPKPNYEEYNSIDDDFHGEAVPPPPSELTMAEPVQLDTSQLFEELHIDKNSELSKSSFSNSETELSEIEIKSTDLTHKCQIIEVKDLIHCRKDNIIYFVDNKGNPCDEGALKLIEHNKIEPNQILNYLNVISTKRNNGFYYFSLCIREDDKLSIYKVKENIFKVLRDLKELIIKLNLKTISISYSKNIENLDWTKIKDLLKLVFNQLPLKIVICKNSLKYVTPELRDKIFYELHDSPIGGHRGVSKTYNRIRQTYYWENLKDDIQRRIQQCLNCQLKKLTRLKTKQPMVITDTPGTVFDKIAMDIVGPLQKTKNEFEYILTMQDQLSKFCLGVPLKNTLATTIADAFVKRFICIFGAPRIVLTDQGQNFLSKLMSRVAKRFKIKKIKTTAFHPQSNGSLERSHHALGEFLKQYTNKDSEWDEWLDLAMLNYNTCISESTKHTPYEVIFGRLARLPSSDPLRELDLLPNYNGYLIDLVTRLNGIRTLVYDNLVDAKNRSKKYYDRAINPRNFKLGDYVYLLKGPKPNKFGDHYTGPHKILEIIDNTNIRISINKTSKVVHANRLRISHINQEIKVKKKPKNKKLDD